MMEAVRCELIRDEVFDGKIADNLGEPDQWLALLIESRLQAGQGQATQSEELRLRVRDAGASGHIDGKPSSGSPTPIRGRVRCWKRSSTDATTGPAHA
jgi:type VI secretion system protein ImpE